MSCMLFILVTEVPMVENYIRNFNYLYGASGVRHRCHSELLRLLFGSPKGFGEYPYRSRPNIHYFYLKHKTF